MVPKRPLLGVSVGRFGVPSAAFSQVVTSSRKCLADKHLTLTKVAVTSTLRQFVTGPSRTEKRGGSSLGPR